MWIVSRHGFLSVVKNLNSTHRHDELLVRARVREDLEDLCSWVVDDTQGHERPIITCTPDHDYPFRALVSRCNLSLYLDSVIGDIEYPNFKDEVARVDRERAVTYSVVWAALHRLQRRKAHVVADGVEVAP